jgi:phosphotransferase system IIB component
MKKPSQMILLFVAMGISLLACKKDPTKKELLVKKWKIDELLVDSANFTPFVTNVRFEFLDNNTVISNELGGDADTSVWTFNAAETQILIGTGADQEVWAILELAEKSLKVHIQDPDEDIKMSCSPATN